MSRSAVRVRSSALFFLDLQKKPREELKGRATTRPLCRLPSSHRDASRALLRGHRPITAYLCLTHQSAVHPRCRCLNTSDRRTVQPSTADFIVVGPIGSGVGPWTACNGPVSELVHVMSANAAAIRYMRHSALGLQRIHLPRTRVKEGKKSRGRGC